MDYKKIFKSRKFRLKLLRVLDFLPDKFMLKLQYRIKFNRGLNLKNPKRLTEKLQWYKLYYRDPLMTECAGKAAVRDYVARKGLSHILNEQYGVYDSADEIDFDAVPEQFVIKATVGAASQQVYICLNKSETDPEEVRKKVGSWMYRDPSKPRKNGGREWAYNHVPQKIVVEKYIDSSACPDGLLSYKIFCFGGVARFLYVIADVKEGYFDADYGIYDTSFQRLPYERVGAVSLQLRGGKPDKLEEMIQIAETLSADFPHVRVDLYQVEGKILFGEMTFYNDSGYMKYAPDEFDLIAGDMFELPTKKAGK